VFIAPNFLTDKGALPRFSYINFVLSVTRIFKLSVYYVFGT